jgi:hypothetical protein
MDADELVRLIEAAWRDVPYPGDGHIIHPGPPDIDDIVDYFAGTTWRGHDATDLRCHSAAFSYFTPEAFHYWLPAFMIAAVRDPRSADVILDNIPSVVAPEHPYDWRERDREHDTWRRFTQPQRDAVAAYLRYQIEQNAAYDDPSAAEREALKRLETLPSQ